MRSFFAAVVFCSALTSLVLSSPPRDYPSNLKLVQVQVAHRHGDRTPISMLPHSNVVWNCPFENYESPNYLDLMMPDRSEMFGHPKYLREYIDGPNIPVGTTCTSGQLTTIGCQQHYELGKNFRSLYIDQLGFMPDVLNTSMIYVRSTDIYRTRQSTECQWLSMYPPEKRSDDDVIIVHTTDPRAEVLYPNTDSCPYLATLLDERTKTDEYKKWNDSMQPLHQKLEQIFGTSMIPSWEGIYDALFCRRSHGIPFPDGITDDIYQQIVDAANFLITYTYDTVPISRLAIGQMLKEMREAMLAAVNGNSAYPWIIWSAHDTTVAPLLIAMNAFDNIWPPYASHVVFELFQEPKSGNFSVRVIYNEKTLVLEQCQGEEICPLEYFLKQLEPVVPDDYVQECSRRRMKSAPRAMRAFNSALELDEAQYRSLLG